jgi:hypothetical protein
MTIMIRAMPCLSAGIALYALTASLFYQDLVGQLKALRVRSRRTGGR